MSWMSEREREIAEAVAQLTYCNPFLPERVECERRILGDAFVDTGTIWHPQEEVNPNLDKIRRIVVEISDALAERLGRGERARSRSELRLCRDLVIYRLYYAYAARFLEMIRDVGRAGRAVRFFSDFEADCERFGEILGGLDEELSPPHLFAFFFQTRRAFELIFRQILGGSMPAARLRATVWESVFTHDMRRYRRSLYRRIGDVTTLITGPSGTGKELVARAVGMSRYIPFRPESRSFAEDFQASFYPLNLSALTPTLIESELFGHRRGAFTGAIENRRGWLEICPPLGTVFLDEIGEIDPAIQVKLLRVLQARAFQRIGDTKDQRFQGKIIAATNRDLEAEMRRGTIREDFYYRLCSDLIITPSLREQLADAPCELDRLVRFLSQRIAGPEEAEAVTTEVVTWVRRSLGPDYAWPGNVRELEQCVRNVMIRGEYRPAFGTPADSEPASLEEAFERGLTMSDLESWYVSLAYARTGSYVAAGKRLGLDRRTVKAKVDMATQAG